MSFHRVFLSEEPTSDTIRLTGQEAHHLIHVLRMEPDRSLELIDGSGRLWLGKIGRIFSDHVLIVDVVLSFDVTKPGVEIAVIQALCKTDRLEWILQKLTEIGIAEIYLLKAQRSVVKIVEERLESKLKRWQTIIVNAAKQSRRTTFPKLHKPSDLLQICQNVQSEVKFFLDPNLKSASLKERLRHISCKSAAISIGPEGGWTEEECTIFVDCGFQPTNIGTNILRTETASIVTSAILQYELTV